MRQATCSAFRTGFVAVVMLLTVGFAGAVRAADPAPQTPPLGVFIYTISRDGTPIGQERMEFVNDAGKLRVISRMELDVTLLGLNIYGFSQQVEELHADGRIVSLSSDANDDGTPKKLALTLQGGSLVGHYNDHRRHDIDPALKTTLFWQKPATGATQVLDTVRGQPRDVTVIDVGAETLNLPVGRVEARHLKVTGELQRELWYDANGILVAGQVTAKDGSIVRQELQQRP